MHLMTYEIDNVRIQLPSSTYVNNRYGTSQINDPLLQRLCMNQVSTYLIFAHI